MAAATFRFSPDMAQRLLAYRRDTFRGEDAPVFVRKSGDELYPQNLSKAVLKPSAEALGLGWVTFHTLPSQLRQPAVRWGAT